VALRRAYVLETGQVLDRGAWVCFLYAVADLEAYLGDETYGSTSEVMGKR
jgi:hypothetical protein